MSCFLPKKELNVDNFLHRYPAYNGRGVLVAIWDTGVDPTAAGLQVTPDGRPKVVDFIDASGSGDVNMCARRQIDPTDRELITLSGRKVQIPPTWNPSGGTIHLGVKLASELFPRSLLQRLRSDEKEQIWQPCMKQLVADLADSFSRCSLQLSGATDDQTLRQNASKRPDKATANRLGTDSSSDKASLKTELYVDANLFEESLTAMDKGYIQFDPVYDCFVFHDGTDWIACVDTSPYEPGKTLSDMPLLKDYTAGRQVACFGKDTQLYFTVKILDDGRLLQIVTNDSGHGTHVAAITAAYFPPDEKSENADVCRDGVAPGAQIVSIKISDSRLTAMETGLSLLRAIRWTVDLKCDVVNYSFGENCMWPNIGRVSKHLREMVTLHGIVFVASGGNNGPGLCTLSCPGGTIQDLIGVAPLVYPHMMRSMYCQPFDDFCDDDEGATTSNSSTLIEPVAYTWGSRGPTVDGALGLCVAAPGAADTSVPGWQLRPAALLNGSSMSSPMVAACVALLLSGLRQSNQKTPVLRIPPALIRLALCNTASPLPNLSMLDQGHGVVQVDKAYDFLMTALKQQPSRWSKILKSLPDPMIEFGWRLRCTVSSGPGCHIGPHHRGIWLRHGFTPRVRRSENNSAKSWLPMRYTVQLTIDFTKSVPLEFRRCFELHLTVSAKSNWWPSTHQTNATQLSSTKVPWLQIAKSVTLNSAGRDLQLIIDPNKFMSQSNLTNEAASVHSQDDGRCSKDPSVQSLNSTTEATSVTCTCASEPWLTMVQFSDKRYEHLGYLAEIPITVLNPIRLNNHHGENPRLLISDQFDSSHKVRRWFVEIPTGATAGVLRLSRLDDRDASCKFKVTVTISHPGGVASEQEVTWPLLTLNQKVGSGESQYFSEDGPKPLVFAIPWGADCLELTISQHWGLEAPATVYGELVFRGLESSSREVSMCTSDQYIRLMLRSNFATEEISPFISLTHWVLPLKPTSSRIVYLGHGKGEALLTGRGCYALRLVYQFACPFKFSLTQFELPWLHDLLYENDYLLQLYHIYDRRGRFLGAGEYDVKHRKKPKFAISLDKGDYKVIVQICHESGPNLMSTEQKASKAPPAPGNTSEEDRTGGLTGGDAISCEGPTPLERVRNQPALVRFKLPVSGNQSEQAGNARPQTNRVNSVIPVTFEFAAFPFSLGLNGGRPCSALDPLPLPIGDSRGRSNQMDSVAETNRRCSCIPASLMANESTSIYLGLADQKYPPYAVSGSYFLGSIGFYNAEMLRNTVTYPFRLNLDNSNNSTVPVKLNAGSDPAGCLAVGCFGFSLEDFTWLLPVEFKLGVYGDVCCSSETGPRPDDSLLNGGDNGQPDISKSEVIEQCRHNVSETSETESPELRSESVASKEQLGDHLGEEILSHPTPIEAPSVTTSVANSETKQPLSAQLSSIHQKLILIDTPISSTDRFTDVIALQASRSSIWSQANELITGCRELVNEYDQTSSETRVVPFLHHLLTMKLVPADKSNRNASNDVSEMADVETSIQETSPVKPETAEQSGVNQTSTNNKTRPGSSRTRSQSTFSYMELKLRLIDTLSRYGRLLCEQLIFANSEWPARQLDSALLGPFTETDHKQFRQSYKMLQLIYYRLLSLITKSSTSTDSIGESVSVGNHALPGWLLVSGLRKLPWSDDCPIEATSFESLSQHGTIAGRLSVFFLLYFVVQGKIAQALRFMTRLVYQLDDPPTSSHDGAPKCHLVSSLGKLRPVRGSQDASLKTGKRSLCWLLWILEHRLGWHTLSQCLRRQSPILFPERDYSLMFSPDN